MIKTEKKKPFVLNREQHRYLKSLSKDGLMEWLRQFYCEVYNEAISETYLAVMRHLLQELYYFEHLITFDTTVANVARELGFNVELDEKGINYEISV